MTFEKQYNEIYAITLLSHFWADYKEGFIKFESPDWLNKEYKIGVEVTQALLQYEGEAQKLIDLYLGKEKESIPKEQLDAFGSRLVFYRNRLQAVLPPEGMSHFGYVFKALYRFDKKLLKLNSNYMINDKNCLYMFLHTNAQQYDDIQLIFTAMQKQQSTTKEHFSNVFLDCGSTVYVLNFETKEIEIIELLKEQLMQLESETDCNIANHIYL